MQIRYYLKLILNLSSILLISFGIILNTNFFLIIGSALFLVSLAVNTLSVIVISRRFKNTISYEQKIFKGKSNINNLLEALVILYGIIALIISDPSYLKYSGQIIWFGSILFYILNGIIAGWITNLPLTMTYGGWKIRNKKHQQRK